MTPKPVSTGGRRRKRSFRLVAGLPVLALLVMLEPSAAGSESAATMISPEVRAEWNFTLGHADDISGNGHDGVVGSGVDFVTGGARFNGGVDGKIEVPYSDAYHPESGDSWRVRLTDVVPEAIGGDAAALLSTRDSDQGGVTVYILPSGEFVFWMAQDGGAAQHAKASSGVVAEVGKSYDIVAEWDRSTATITVTGDGAGSGSASVDPWYLPTRDGTPLRMGAGGGSGDRYFYTGKIGGLEIQVEPRSTPYRKAGSWTRQSSHFDGDAFYLRKLDDKGSAAKLSHLFYSFGRVSPDGLCTIPSYNSEHDYEKLYSAERSVDGVADDPEQPLAGNFNQIKKLKAKYGMRTSIQLGGGSGSEYFSQMASTDSGRKAFVESCITRYIKGDLPPRENGKGGPGVAAGVFDGIDINWEYPNDEDGSPEDKVKFTRLLAEFRQQLDEYTNETGKYYVLTASIGGSSWRIEQSYEVPEIFDYLDWALVMVYDLHGHWETPLFTNHQAALYHNPDDPSSPARSADIYMNNFVDAGVPAERLVLGVPFYSRGWTGVPGASNGLFQEAASGSSPAARTYRAVKRLLDEGFTRYWDDAARSAWLFDGDTFWTFDDEQVIDEKTTFVKARGLGGVGVWALNQDDAGGALMAEIDRGLR